VRRIKTDNTHRAVVIIHKDVLHTSTAWLTIPLMRVLNLRCYKSVTRVLQECYKSVTRVLQECYKSVARDLQVLQECNKSVTRVFTARL
jgi:hypothetical protein